MAIAIDAGAYVTNSGGATATLSTNITIAASPANPYLVIHIKNVDNAAGVVSSVTVNGSSTGVSKVTNFQSGLLDANYQDSEIWHCVAPPTGTIPIVVNLTGVNGGLGLFSFEAVSYTGVDQSSPVDAVAALGLSAGGNAIDVTATVVATGCWMAASGITLSGKYAIANNGQTNMHSGNEGQFQNLFLASSTSTVGTGSQSLSFITNDSGNADLFQGIGYSFKPVSGAVTQNKDIASRADFQQNVNRGFASRTTRWTRGAIDLWNKRRSGIFVPRGFYPLLA